MQRAFWITVFFASALQIIPSVSASTINVKPDGTGDYPTIQAATDAAVTEDIIVLQSGTYTGAGNRDIDFKGKAITVRSTDPNDKNIVAATIINCQGTVAEPHRGFQFYTRESAASVIAGLTITNGYGPNKWEDGQNSSRGGAIHCFDHSSPTIKNCVIKSNQAGYGGAIENYASSSPVIENCTFVDNIASDGTLGYGGAIYCQLSSRPKLANCLFLHNRVTAPHGDGGAIWNQNGGPQAINCSFISNSAEWGGAVCSSGPAEYDNCIFWDNHCITRADDIGNKSGSTITIKNCLFSCGLNSPCLYNGGSLVDGGGNISGDPNFINFAAKDFRLSYDSPCVDAGTNSIASLIPTNDLDGQQRFVDGNGDSAATVDIGAFEFQEPERPLILLSSNTFEFLCTGQENPQAQILEIRKEGAANLNWHISKDADWLQVMPMQGRISNSEANQVLLTVNAAGLSGGTHNCKLIISDSNASNSPQQVDVALYVRCIQFKIDAAGNGDIVIISPGTYSGKYNCDLDFKGKAITVRSVNPEDPNIVAATIIDCNGSPSAPHRGFYFHSGEIGNSIVSGFTITRGYADSGAGIQCENSSPVITNCNLINGAAQDWGGGIFCWASSAQITKCKFTGNSAREGGAITVRAGDFSGTYFPVISDCEIYGNMGTDDSGGINCDTLTTPTISNCVIRNNSGGSYGGAGIAIFQSNPTITNCTIVNNTSTGSGPGIVQWYPFLDGSKIKNCIIWGNIAPDMTQVSLSNNTAMNISYCDIQNGRDRIFDPIYLTWGTGNIDTDPLFPFATTSDFHLQSQRGRWNPGTQQWVHDVLTSPCIDAGDPGSSWSKELYPHGKRVNMGAYGGTAQASMSLSYAGNATDLNSDGRVDMSDFAAFANGWLSNQVLLAEDLDRDGSVSARDLATLAANWLAQGF